MANHKSSLLDTWATWIVALSVVALIFCFVGYFGCVLCVTPKVSESVRVVVVQDSTCDEVLYNKSQVDSIVHLLQKQNLELKERFQIVMEQESKEDLTKNFFMVIASVLISICAFFGYKSIKDMKEGIRNSVEGLASNVAREKTQEIAAQESRIVAKKVAAELSKTIATKVSINQSTITAKRETKSYLQNNVKEMILKHADSIYRKTMIISLREEVLKDLDEIIEIKIKKIFNLKKSPNIHSESTNAIHDNAKLNATSNEPKF